MTEALTITDDPAALEAVLGSHPYPRWTTDPAKPRTTYLSQEVTAWISAGHRGRMLCAMGEPGAALRLATSLRADGELDAVVRLHLPRTDGHLLAAELAVPGVAQWDFRWCRRSPAPVPDADVVQQLTEADYPGIDAVLDQALPDSGARPGAGHIRTWYGIRAAGQLVACLADTTRHGVGSLAGIAVVPAYQGRGLGATLTATVTRRLMSDLDTVALGVMADNQSATRLYQRLGFTGVEPRTSFPWPPATG